MKKQAQNVDPIEKDFLDAIERIKSGKPKEASIKAKVKQVKLKLNASAVAIEAGHSRTLIGHAGCQYPQVRAMLLGEKITKQPHQADELSRLKLKVQELRRMLAAALDQNAVLLAKVVESGSKSFKGCGR